MMSLNDIQLVPQLIASLYKSTLLGKDMEQGSAVLSVENVTAPQADPSLFLGNNRKKVLLLVHYPDYRFLPDVDMKLLISILTACKLSMEDVVLINLAASEKPDYKAIQEQWASRYILFLGTEPGDIHLPVQFPNFQVQKFQSSLYLASPPLHALGQDVQLKGKLWECLKTMFGL